VARSGDELPDHGERPEGARGLPHRDAERARPSREAACWDAARRALRARGAPFRGRSGRARKKGRPGRFRAREPSQRGSARKKPVRRRGRLRSLGLERAAAVAFEGTQRIAGRGFGSSALRGRPSREKATPAALRGRARARSTLRPSAQAAGPISRGIASGSSAAAIICSPLSGVRRRVDGALHPDPCDERARAGARECPAAVTAIDASPSAAADPLHAPAAARASCRPITRPAFRPRGNASATPLPCPFPGRSRGASTDRRDAPSWGPTPAASEGPTRTAPDAGSLRRTGSSAARRRSCRRGRGRAGTGRRPRA
jgi:hypothetical protein